MFSFHLSYLFRHPTSTYRPTQTWYPTATWNPTATQYPTRSHGGGNLNAPTSRLPPSSEAQAPSSYKPYENTGYHEPRLAPTDSGASPSSSSTDDDRITEQPLTDHRSGGFGFGMGLLLAVVAAAFFVRHRSRQRQQQYTDGLELFDIGSRRFGSGYSDVPDADIRGPNREVL